VLDHAEPDLDLDRVSAEGSTEHVCLSSSERCMSESAHFALVVVLLTAAVGLVAVLSNRSTERVKVPVPLLVLVGAASAARVIPSIQAPPERTVERLVTVCVVLILFDRGAQMRSKRRAVPNHAVTGSSPPRHEASAPRGVGEERSARRPADRNPPSRHPQQSRVRGARPLPGCEVVRGEFLSRRRAGFTDLN
jgi:hypothetical protein